MHMLLSRSKPLVTSTSKLCRNPRSTPTSGSRPRFISHRPPLIFHEEVADALANGKPIVALESAIITHGMPYPINRDTALLCETSVRSVGAVPATIGMIAGKLHIGLSLEQIERLADESNFNKCKLSRRDLAPAMALKMDGGSTIAATMILAHLAGIKVFSTGGLGGVHRGVETTMDISADLTELGRTPVAVVSAGVKSILDIGRTLEYLETEGATVVSYSQKHDFPGFFSPASGFKSQYAIDSPTDIAQMLYNGDRLGLQSGTLVAVPIPAEYEEQGRVIQGYVEQAIKESEENGVNRLGKDATPWLLRRVTDLSKGLSIKNNITLIENTSLVGGRIAVELAKLQNGETAGSRAVETTTFVSAT